jgi:hypothetical protein
MKTALCGLSFLNETIDDLSRQARDNKHKEGARKNDGVFHAAHNPVAPELLEYADRYGMLVWEENRFLTPVRHSGLLSR